jgi:DNA-binding beta-propeller fold protein YncE
MMPTDSTISVVVNLSSNVVGESPVLLYPHEYVVSPDGNYVGITLTDSYSC